MAAGFRVPICGGTGFGRSSRPKPEGDVTVRQTASAQKKVNRNVGDYVDYEEVKEEAN